MATQVFRTPEQVAPELGMKPTELRRYVRESGICTRLSKNRIMFHDDDVERLVAWVRERNAPTEEQKEIDPFA
ncbi:excisionase [Arthrobacter phage BrayBeast]